MSSISCQENRHLDTATGLVQGTIGAATHVGTELAYGRTPTFEGTLKAGLTSGLFAAGAKFVAQSTGLTACFVAGTQVLTSSGSVSIENISAGDYVYATDPETGISGYKRVIQTFERETDEIIRVTFDDETITTTPTHPFYVPEKGWTEAIQLRAGDILVTSNGDYLVVELVKHEILESPIKVYNFEVEDYHTYYVGENESSHSVFVHNKCNGNWSKGSYDSAEASELDHFIRHGKEVGASSIEQYTRKATAFANEVLSKRCSRRLVEGVTKNVYRYCHGGKYIDLVFDEVEHLIVSFGKLR